MKKLLLCISFGFTVSTAFSAIDWPTTTIDSLAREQKKTDDLENFTYSCLDYYLLKPVESRLNIFDLFEKERWRHPKTNEEFLAYVILLCNKGYYLTHFGAVYKAIDAYEKALQLFDEHHLTGFDIIEYCLKPLGNNYSMLGDYSSAENIVREYLFRSAKEKNYNHSVSASINLSIIFHDTGRHLQAIDLLSEALSSKKATPQKRGHIYSMLANNYVSLQDFNQAKKYSNLAIKSFLHYPAEDNPVHLVNSYKMLAFIFVRENKLIEAQAQFKKAQGVASQFQAFFKPRELAKLSLEYADLLKIMGKHTEALASYYSSLTILIPSFSASNTMSLPQPSTFYAENAIKETLDGLAELYFTMHQTEKAIACYELSFSVEDLLRNTYNYQQAKLQQQIENRKRAERTIELVYQLARKTGKHSYTARAFQIAERTRALTLKESIEDKYMRQFIRQDTLLTKERELVFKQAMLASEIILEQTKRHAANVNYLQQLITRQTKLTIDLKSIEKTIDEKYPEFINEGRASVWLNLDSLQKKLQKDDAVLLEYVATSDSLFAFVVGPNSIILKKVQDQKTVDKHLADFVTLFSNASAINNDVEAYKQLAFSLYKELGLSEVPASKKIILIPDGLLHAIPFDALLFEATTSTHYSTLPYLIKKNTLGYQASASLYMNGSRQFRVPNNQEMFAMFPVFENTTQVLAYSMQEAEKIKRLFPQGNYLLNNQATKSAFLKNASNHSIIHLSTHAVSGNSVDPPSIYFIDSVLHLPQVYGLHLTTDLLVLSACETGIGAIARGEGALSLAHGFQFAGVRNIILSLWKVNDKSTAVLFSRFYEHYLKLGEKASSLQQAKLDYLQDDAIENSLKSPFYWAAFIYYGDYRRNEIKNNQKTLNVIFLIGILSVAGYFFYRKRRRK